jgi:hypothetical protein
MLPSSALILGVVKTTADQIKVGMKIMARALG